MIGLRRAGPEDLDAILGLEERYYRLGFIGHDARAVHEGRMASADARYFAVEGGSCAGFVILCGVADPNRSIELKRIVVDPPGSGAGRDALRLVIALAFGELGAHRLWLDVYTDNERARRVYRSLGFVEEGTMRECVFDGGRFRSLVLMSMLEAEVPAR